MSKRDSKQIERLNELITEARAIVREEIVKRNASMQHHYDALGLIEVSVKERLKELRDWNAAQDTDPVKPKEPVPSVPAPETVEPKESKAKSQRK